MSPRILLVSALACASAFAAEPAKKQNFAVEVKAGGIHEECVKLAKGESRRYQWSSNAVLDFNIHYHEANEVFYPFQRTSVTKGKGTFKAKIDQDYCWMWTAKTPAKLEGSLR